MLLLAVGLTVPGLHADEPDPVPPPTKQLYIYFGDKAREYDEKKKNNPHWNLEILDIDRASAQNFKWMLQPGGKKDMLNPAGRIQVDLKKDEPDSYLPGNLPSQTITSTKLGDSSIMLSPKTYYYISFRPADPVKGKNSFAKATIPLFNHTFMLFKKGIGGFVFHAHEDLENKKPVFKLECLGQCEWVKGTTYQLSKWDGESSSKKSTNKIFMYQSDRNSSTADYSDMRGMALSIIQN
jgi:hypothetical protein